jgi:hypothetical protein
LVQRSHCAVGRFLGSVVFLPWAWPVAFQRPVNAPLVEFHLPPECYPTDPSQPTAVRRLLSWASGPFSTCQNRRFTCRELAGLTPLRLQGLVTLLTAYSLRNLVGSVSHRQRSWDSPFGVLLSCQVSNVFPHRMNPRTVSTRRCSRVPKHRTGPTGRGSWVVTLPRGPIEHRWV